MYIIVIGAGKVGFHLAKELVEANHEVLVIEQDTERAKATSDDLGDIVMEGDGCEATVLEKAGTSRADMLLAVTGDDEDNLVSCQVAKQRFNVARTVARINDPKNEEIFRKLEVDITVSATSAIMAHIEQELPTHHLIPLMRLKGSGLEIVEIRIPEDSRVVGQAVRSIMLPYQSMISLIVGEDGQPKVPSGETIIHAGDEVVAVTMHQSEEALREALMAPPPAAQLLVADPPRVAYLGPAGTNSEVAALIARPGAEYLPFPTIVAAARALEAGHADCAVLPVENSLQGTVTDTVDLLVHDEDIAISGEVVLRIEHCLMVQPGATRDQIEVVYSHPQSLGQCRRYLETNFPRIRTEAALSNAEAVQVMMRTVGAAAIGPSRARRDLRRRHHRARYRGLAGQQDALRRRSAREPRAHRSRQDVAGLRRCPRPPRHARQCPPRVLRPPDQHDEDRVPPLRRGVRHLHLPHRHRGPQRRPPHRPGPRRRARAVRLLQGLRLLPSMDRIGTRATRRVRASYSAPRLSVASAFVRPYKPRITSSASKPRCA